jgi:hypothetical protein
MTTNSIQEKAWLGLVAMKVLRTSARLSEQPKAKTSE